MDIDEFEVFLEKEISRITQADLVATIKAHRVSPRLEDRDWDYGEAGEKYPCWVGVENISTDTAIAYCEQGFGPSNPWGLLALKAFPNMGMDSGWFTSLEDAVRESKFWQGNNPEGYEVS